MNAFQRLLLGIGAGGLITLLAFPAPRAFLFHPLHRQALRSAFQNHSLSQNPSPLKVPQEAQEFSPEERFLIAHSIAHRLTQHPGNVNHEDYELAILFLSGCWQLDPDNAFWPQLISAVHVRCGHPEAGKRPWLTAATLSRWDSGTAVQLETLWETLARVESHKMAWQGFATLPLRRDEHTQLIQKVPEALLPASPQSAPSEDIKIRVATIANASLLRSGATSLLSATKAIAMALTTIGVPMENLNPQQVAQLERRRGAFENQVNKVLGPQHREKTQRDLEALITSRFHLMEPQQIYATQQKTFLQALAVTSLPSAFLLAGLAFAGMWGLGVLIRATLGTIPHPDVRLVALSGFLLASLVLISRAPWMLAVWFALLGVLLALPVEIGKSEPVPWSWRSQIVLNAILAVGALFALVWIILSNPSAEHLPIPISPSLPSSANPSDGSFILSLKDSPSFQATQEAPRWRYLFIFTLSLSVVFAVAWARLKSQAVFFALGETWAYIGLNGMLLSLTACVIITPVCLFIDRNLQNTAHSWITNEPLAFEIG